MGYKQRRIIWDDVEVNSSELITMAEAAGMLEVSFATIHHHMMIGRLPTLINTDEPPTAHNRPHRYTLRREVEALKAEREAEQAQEDGQG